LELKKKKKKKKKKREEKLKGLKIYTKEEQKQTCVAMRATVST